MTKKQKKSLVRILSGCVLFLLALLFPGEHPLLFLVPYSIIAWDIPLRAVGNILRGQLFDENFLMTAASIGAFGSGQYHEAAAVMSLYQIGELFQDIAVANGRRSIAALMDIRPDFANVLQDGQIIRTDPSQVDEGDMITVTPGERIPLDGVVTEGSSALDTAALTGESEPRDVFPGDEVLSGCINLSGVLHIRVLRTFDQSTVCRILELVEDSISRKAKSERFITKFARYYTPAVVCAAGVLAILPPLLGLGTFSNWLQRSLVFLVVSCPCALVISVPLSFFSGIGRASREGILIKGSNYLEALAKTGIVVFDKTGTLTKGIFQVSRICPVSMKEEELLVLAAAAEQLSTHPISRSIRDAAPCELPPATQVKELPGQGVRAVVTGMQVLAGSETLLAGAGISCPHVSGTVVHVGLDGSYCGYILLADQLKPTSARAVEALKQSGIRRTVMLTGDAAPPAEHTARQLGLDEFHAQLLPGDKVTRLEHLLREKKPGEQLLFVGDGINDAPVLARADIGVAMGALGSDAAIEAADIVLMDDDPAKLITALSIARKTMTTVRQNIIFALGVKFLVLALAAAGFSSMWLAVFADVGVSILAIVNASRQ